MPMSIYKYSNTPVGKIICVISVIMASYYSIIFGIAIAVLFIIISELSYYEGFLNISAKEDFYKKHCESPNKTKFDLQTIEKDYMGLKYCGGVCNPCDSTCRYTINNTSKSLYNFNNLIKPIDDANL